MAPLIAYVRVSRKGDREDDRFHSPQEQTDRARSHAASKGLAVGEVVEDIDVSGATHPRERPGMSRALEAIKSGKAGGLVAFSLDRLSRDPNHGDWLVREVTSHGGVITTPDMPEDITSPTGEFTFGMLLAVARLYRRTAGARFESAKERATRAGIAVGSVPLGYRKRPDRTLEPDPETAPLVVAVFEARAAGASWTTLAEMLAKATGRNWSRQAVPRILANPIYHTGHIQYGEWVSDVEAGALVDVALWHAAQRPKFVRDGRTEKAKWLLSGLLRCEGCGRSLVPWTPAKGQKGTARRYRCHAMGCSTRVSVHADAAEDLVVREAFAVSKSLVSVPTEAVELAPLEEALEVATRRFEQVQSPAAQDALGEAWAATAKERREARDAAAAALGEARQAAGVEDGGGRVLELGHIWDDLDPQQQREALRWAFTEVRVARVPRGERPAFTFVRAADRPFRLEFRPPDLVEL